MQASPARQLPDTLDGVDLRTVARQIIERKAVSLFLPPFAVKKSMEVFGVVNDDHDLPPASATGRSQVAEIITARHGVELLRFAPEEELAVAQADHAEITHAASAPAATPPWHPVPLRSTPSKMIADRFFTLSNLVPRHIPKNRTTVSENHGRLISPTPTLI